MLRNIRSLIGFKLRAEDGELGAVDEFYFDDATWGIRYMVVRTGPWLAGRKVLVSTAALKTPDWKTRTFPVALTLEQVRNSPDVDTEKTVSRRHELELHEHYAWPLYWGESFYAGGASGSPLFMAALEKEKEKQAAAGAEPETHLQGTSEVTGYALHAADGQIGHVEDFIFDDAAWDIRYFVADTGIWLPGRKVLISPHWIERVEWETSEVFVDLTREAVRKSPQYDPSQPVSESYESELYDHYGRPKFENAGREPAGGRGRR